MTDRRVVLLCGPPGAGKTTAAHLSGLTVYDIDDPQWPDEATFRAALAGLAHDPAARAVVIRSGATSSARAKTAALIRATHVYVLLADPDTLKDRVRNRARADVVASLAAINTWPSRFDRRDNVADFPGWDNIHRESPGLGDSIPDWW